MKIQKILIATDFSDYSKAAHRRGFDLARQFGSEVLLLHVIPTSSFTVLPPIEAMPDTDSWLKEARANASDLMDLQVKEVDFGGCSLTTEIHDAESAAGGLIERAQDEGVDLIVMGTHGRRGLRRLTRGSVAEEVVRLAPCAVLTCAMESEAGETAPKQLLAAIDFSDQSNSVLRVASDLSQLYGAALQIIHVVPSPHYAAEYAPIGASATNYLTEMHRIAGDSLRVRVETVLGSAESVDLKVVTGSPSQSIVSAAETSGAELIVLGCRGLSGTRHLLLGSVADRVVRHSECPVLVLRADTASEEGESESAA